jgi:type II secretory pathway component GspD/PulD (secretin)
MLLAAQAAWGQVYCNVDKVEAKALANGVQISVHSDGTLDWGPPDGNWNRFHSGDRVSELAVRFPQARSKLDDNFIDVSVPPVSYLQVSVPQDAKLGIGLDMRVVLSEPARFETSTSADQQTWMVTFLADRTVDRNLLPGGGKGAASSARSDLAVECQNGLVSVRCTNADIHQVVGEVAHQGGINAAVDDAVQHRVSLRLSRMKPLDVLRSIAAGYGLALSTDDQGDTMISEGVPRDMATYNRSGTASFPMKYLRAAEAQSLLPTFLFSYLHANMEQNAIVVTAPSQMLKKIESDLRQVDLPPPLIMVEVLAVELTHTKNLAAGLHWSSRSHTDVFSTDPRTGAVDYHRAGPDDFDPGVTPTDALAIRLDALIDKGEAKIRANPRMAAANGQEAEIFIGAMRFIKVTFLQYGQQQERIQSVPVGVRLTVTPWTGGNREITSHIVAEVSNIVELDSATGLPLLSTRRAENTVRAADGETIVIGGLTQRQQETRNKKIPVLGDIPILGNLFRQKTTSDTDTELVLLITPRVLTENGQLPDAAAERAVREKFLEPGDHGYLPPPKQPAEQRRPQP